MERLAYFSSSALNLHILMLRHTIALLSLLPLSALEAAHSNIMGISSINIKAGNVPIAPAYVHPKELGFSVNSTALAGDELTLNLPSNSLTAGAYEESSLYPRYYIEVISEGAFAGMVFDVVSNTAGAVTIKTWADGSQPVSSGTAVILRKHMTLDDFFADAESQLIGYGDTLKFFDSNGDSKGVVWDGSIWTTDFSTDDGGMPIYPGQGFLTIFVTDKTFNVLGEVKSTPTQVPVYVGAINFVGTLSPIEESFNSFEAMSWMSPYAETIKLFTSDGTLSSAGAYVYDGSKITGDFVSDDGADPLPATSSFLITPVGDISVPIPAAYPVN
jgi:hypothetical protein